MGGQLHRGTAGAAGEIGYLPVRGAPLHTDIRHPASGGFQSLAGAVPDEPVLRGAMLAALVQARAVLLASVADPQ